jgi:O-antigen/teichoic acid export membrane protein
MALSLISAPLLIRSLGVVEFGRYLTALSAAALATGATEAGLTTAALREYAVLEGRERTDFMRDVLGMRLALSGAGVAVAVAFMTIAGYGGQLVLGTLLAGVGLLLSSVQLLLAVPLAASLRLGWVTALDLVRQVFTVALIAGLVIGGAGVLAFLAVVPIAAVVPLLVTVVIVRGQFPLRPRVDLRRWWNVLRVMLPFTAIAAISAVYFRLTLIITSLVATPVATGYFATAFRLLEVLIFVPTLLVTTAFPILSRAARDDRERLRYAMRRVLEVALVGGAGMALVVAVGAPFIIDVIAGPKGHGAVEPLRIQALALLPNFIAAAAGYGLLSMRRHAAGVISLGLGIVCNVALVLALAPAHGATGAAIAIAAAETVIAVSLYVQLLRHDAKLALPLRTWLRVAAGAAPAVAVAVLTGLPSVVTAILAGAIYLALMVAQRAVPEELFDALLPSRRKRASASSNSSSISSA